MTAQDLIAFEAEVARRFNSGLLPQAIHLSGGNEERLIEIFQSIRQEDWVVATHRAHYHYLLKGGSPQWLMALIERGDSMHIYDKRLNFVSSAIVGGGATIAVGIAGNIPKGVVYCFLGDGAMAQGSVYEAIRYATLNNLSVRYIVEDNGYAVDTLTEVWGYPNVTRYTYTRTYPHVGTGQFVEAYK